ncbi:hypothetical protein A6770_25665 [Nostoc minutum NIES-26]|uniref:Uncharacterized protein n=1 Tax=Nostoc minutum NIES-26 TaxID=1844469 RepID=A0A367QUX1_9NOSO|nr:hypothetical protein A6770_25665 [Nostoc minutum NIES-26]
MRWLKIVSFFLSGIIIGYALALILSQASNYVPLVSLAVSSVIAIGIPIWREYFVTSSRLSVEINSIERNVADKVQIDLREYQDLVRLSEIADRATPFPQLPIPRNSRDFNIKPREPAILEGIEELDDFFESLKKEFDGLPQKIEQLKKYDADLSDIEPEKFSAKEARDFVSSVFFPTRLGLFNPDEFKEPEQRKEKHEEFKKELKKQIDKLEERQRKLQPPLFNIQDAKEAVNKIKKELVDNRSRFSVSISLVNSGRLNTSIKVPAILRVYIARGTYVNLELTMKDPESRSEVPANSTKVVVFESREISQLPEDGRNLVNEYWKNNVYCALFLEDVRGKIYSSNPIVFASGVYQKIIYDRLANAAASYNPWLDIR